MAHDQDREKQGDARLDSLAASLGDLVGRAPAPVEAWDPPFCGDIAMRIAADGTWHYAGSPITRPALVRLFAGVLRRDPTGYMLVTPAERVGITVEDAPFIGVSLVEDGDTMIIGTNLGEAVRVDADHPLRFTLDAAGGVKPYVRVRGALWAKLTRALALEVLDRAREAEDGSSWGIAAGGQFFPIEAQQVAPV